MINVIVMTITIKIILVIIFIVLYAKKFLNHRNFYIVYFNFYILLRKSYSNHLKSNKHKDQTKILQKYMKEEDKILFNESEIDLKDDELQETNIEKNVIKKSAGKIVENELNDQIEKYFIIEKILKYKFYLFLIFVIFV